MPQTLDKTAESWAVRYFPPGHGVVPANFKIEPHGDATLAAIARFTTPGTIGEPPAILLELRQQAEAGLQGSPAAKAVTQAEAQAQTLRDKIAAFDAKISAATRKREDPAVLDLDNPGETLLALDAEIKLATTSKETAQRTLTSADKHLAQVRGHFQYALNGATHQLKTEAVNRAIAERAELLAELGRVAGPVLSKLLDNERPLRVLCKDSLAADHLKESNQAKAPPAATRATPTEDDDGELVGASDRIPFSVWCGAPTAAIERQQR